MDIVIGSKIYNQGMGVGNFHGKDYKSELDESYGEVKPKILLTNFQF